MDYSQLEFHKRSLHQQILSEVLQKNEEKIRIWTDFKNKHEAVLKSLQILPLEISINCLIPIGKQALIEGKLKHTSEILVCLGEEYFVNYSAAQAIELTNRRIKRTEEVLRNLQEEKVLFESRQDCSSSFGAFGSNATEELIEHWNVQELENWRVQHRQREKQYHEKISQQKHEENHSSAEEELFRRLDELEVEEELADEFYRLQEENVNDDDDDDDEDYEEGTTENISCYEYQEHDEVKKLMNFDSHLSEETNNIHHANEISENCNKETDISVSVGQHEKQIIKDRKVSFLDHFDVGTLNMNKSSDHISRINMKESNVIHEHPNHQQDVGYITTINFNHSEVSPQLTGKSEKVVNDPRDIYTTFFKPKSILKRSRNDVYEEKNYFPPAEYAPDEDFESKNTSVFNDVVMEVVKEKKQEFPQSESTEPISKKKPVSRFKLARATLNE